MNCIFCNHEKTQVIDGRMTRGQFRRRRRCLNLACGKRFTTYEGVEGDLPSAAKIEEEFGQSLICLFVRGVEIDAHNLTVRLSIPGFDIGTERQFSLATLRQNWRGEGNLRQFCDELSTTLLFELCQKVQ